MYCQADTLDENGQIRRTDCKIRTVKSAAESALETKK
jgi:hypothetical protein